jgi:hypothetical protein
MLPTGTPARHVLHLGRQLDAFGHDHNGKALAVTLAPFHVIADVLHGKGDFGDADDVRASGNAGVQRDPACVAAHHFDHHHAVMRLGGGVNLVDRVGCRGDGGIEAEGDVGGRQIVVDGLGHGHDLHALVKEFERDLLRAVATHGDDGVDAKFFSCWQ